MYQGESVKALRIVCRFEVTEDKIMRPTNAQDRRRFLCSDSKQKRQ